MYLVCAISMVNIRSFFSLSALINEKYENSALLQFSICTVYIVIDYDVVMPCCLDIHRCRFELLNFVFLYMKAVRVKTALGVIGLQPSVSLLTLILTDFARSCQLGRQKV